MCGSALSRSTSASSSASVSVSGSSYVSECMPTSRVCLRLVADIDLARRIVPDDHHRQARDDAVLGLQPRDMAGDARAQARSA